MSDNLKTYAAERLREATTNRDAVLGNIVGDGRAEVTEAAQIARLQEAARESQPTRRGIEDVAIGVLGEVYRESFDYGDVVEVIEQADAGWLYSIILDRALDAVGGV